MPAAMTAVCTAEAANTPHIPLRETKINATTARMMTPEVPSNPTAENNAFPARSCPAMMEIPLNTLETL